MLKDEVKGENSCNPGSWWHSAGLDVSSSVPPHTTTAPCSCLVPPHTTTTTWPPPRPHLTVTHITRPSTRDHDGASLSPRPSIYDDDNDAASPLPSHVLTHLPPHATMTTVPPPRLALVHIARPSTCNHDGASPSCRPRPLCHTHTYGMCYPNIHTLRLSPTMSAHAYAHSESRPALPRLVPPHATMTTVPRPHLAPTSSVPPHATATAPRPSHPHRPSLHTRP